MKADIFTQVVSMVADRYKIKEELIFEKTKEQISVDARHMIYYICYNRPMLLKHIVEYMEERGYKTSHTVVLYGVSRAAKKIKNDVDFKHAVETINKSISIK